VAANHLSPAKRRVATPELSMMAFVLVSSCAMAHHGACDTMLVEPEVSGVPPLPEVALTVTVPAAVVD
jgi:hypothetical protein